MRKNTIGGSALIEGLMMIGPKCAAIAIRKSDGNIIIEKKDIPKRTVISKIPVLRGVVSFVRQMLLAMNALLYSASFMDIEEEDSTSFGDKVMEKIFGDRLKDAVICFSLIASLAFTLGFFILLPNVLAGILHFDKNTYHGVIYSNIFEGTIKIMLFLGYLIITSRSGEVKRVWQYHGAEHKTINCYENGEELTVENVMKYSTKNPRCGTSYMFLVLIVSILVFSFLGWHGMWFNAIARLALMPFVAGLTFEFFMLSSKSDSKLTGIINSPGLFLQLFTTKEPDELQVEVAIQAFNSALA